MLDFAERLELGGLAALVSAVRAGVGGGDVLLVGATARDLLLLHAHGVDTRRATRDVDLAFAVADWQAYEDARRALLASGDFSADKEIHHRLVFRAEHAVDLIPFGGVERADRTVAWPPNGDCVMSLVGFREAMATAVRVRLPGRQEIAVVSLPALAILKLIAWRDRRYTAPGKDAGDLWLLLRHYAEAGNDDRLYVEFAAAFEACGFDLERAGAWLLGADARSVLQGSDACDATLATLHTILAPEIDADGPLRLVGQMPSSDREWQLALLDAFHSGLMGREPR